MDGTRPNPATPDLGVAVEYEYPVELHGDNALAYVIELAGTGKKILEIGAGAGMMTQFLARENEVVAVDVNPDSVEKLKRIVDSVHCLDLNDPRWIDALAKEGKFDVVIAADVLEHLYDPWAALRDMQRLLNDAGEIVVSLPHAGHSAIMACLFQDNFEYREIGLLDKTHIRFFGLENIETLHDRAGLDIIDARIVIRRPEHTEFHERWKRLPRRVRDVFASRPYWSVYQVVTRAKPRAADGAQSGTSFDLARAAALRSPAEHPSLLRRIVTTLTGA